jgi:hypothetical protein
LDSDFDKIDKVRFGLGSKIMIIVMYGWASSQRLGVTRQTIGQLRNLKDGGTQLSVSKTAIARFDTSQGLWPAGQFLLYFFEPRLPQNEIGNRLQYTLEMRFLLQYARLFFQNLH